MEQLLYLTTGISLGACIGFLWARLQQSKMPNQHISLAEVEAQYVNKQAYEQLLTQLKQQQEILEQKEIECIDLHKATAGQEEKIIQLQKELTNKQAELETVAQQLQNNFEQLAQKLLEEKSEKFTRQNQQSISNILTPLQERIKDFEQRVTLFYSDESKQRAGMTEQIRQLTLLNQEMSKEAQNLTRALKGDQKAQGNWGEYILEQILERSGLKKNENYFTQQSYLNEQNRRRQPDLILQLPGNKQIIIDSKVSLTHYERYCSAVNEKEQQEALKGHLNSIENHIKGLSEKKYEQLYQLNSLDFVLLFIPIEPAFTLALQKKSALYYKALEKNIILVSPTNLLATTRTIANIWKQDAQNKNAVEIARQAGLLYDKFVGLAQDLLTLKKQLDKTDGLYQDIMTKLSQGKGALTQRVKKLEALGAKNSKQLPQELEEEISSAQIIRPL